MSSRQRIYNVLFLCTGNSARSILAEAILNSKGRGRFRANSAGSHPTGQVNPTALELLEQVGLPTEDLRSKSWDEFATPTAPPVDFLITVCENAAAEVCPVWPGRPMTAHWGVPDPAHIADNAARDQAFRETYRTLEHRIDLFMSLPSSSLGRMADIAERLRSIGKDTP